MANRTTGAANLLSFQRSVKKQSGKKSQVAARPVEQLSEKKLRDRLHPEPVTSAKGHQTFKTKILRRDHPLEKGWLRTKLSWRPWQG